VGGVFGAEVGGGGAVAVGSLDDYSLRFDIELCKLLLIPLLTVVIARIHPHLHLSIQPCINLGSRVDAMGGELNGGLEIIGDGVGFGNGGTDVVVCGCHGRIRCTT